MLFFTYLQWQDSKEHSVSMLRCRLGHGAGYQWMSQSLHAYIWEQNNGHQGLPFSTKALDINTLSVAGVARTRSVLSWSSVSLQSSIFQYVKSPIKRAIDWRDEDSLHVFTSSPSLPRFLQIFFGVDNLQQAPPFAFSRLLITTFTLCYAHPVNPEDRRLAYEGMRSHPWWARWVCRTYTNWARQSQRLDDGQLVDTALVVHSSLSGDTSTPTQFIEGRGLLEQTDGMARRNVLLRCQSNKYTGTSNLQKMTIMSILINKPETMHCMCTVTKRIDLTMMILQRGSY